MENETFEDWFTNLFVAETKELEGPKLLLLDGHKSHLTWDVIQTALANNITIICLPPHSTNHLQPLDKAVFVAVKNSWRKIISENNKSKLLTGHLYIFVLPNRRVSPLNF